MASLVTRLTELTRVRPDAILLASLDDAPLRALDLLAVIAEVGRTLDALALTKGARVGLIARQGPCAAVILTALVARTGCAPISPTSTEAELLHTIERLKLDAVIVEEGAAPKALEIARARGLTCLHFARVAHEPTGRFVLWADPPPRLCKLDMARRAETPALLLSTSGTTSSSKTVPISSEALAEGVGVIANALELTEGDRCICLMPLFHVAGPFMALWSAWWMGGSAMVPERTCTADALDGLQQLGPTWIAAVPAQLARLSTELKAPLAGLRFIHTGASALAEEAQVRIESAFGCPVVQSYGMTETIMIACNPRERRKPGTVGLPRIDTRIEDPQGRALEPGQQGEICVRGISVIAAYEGHTPGSALRTGWFPTGDRGKLDADGYLCVTGRIKEMINRGGEKIFPDEVDARLEAHPAVAEAACFALPHPLLGEELAAAVVMRPGLTLVTEELRSFVAAELAAHKVPRHIFHVQALPRTESGKKQRAALAKLGLPSDTQVVSFASQRPLSCTDLQAALEAWVSEILGRRACPDATFSELGLDSAALLELRSRAHQLLGVDPGLAPLLQHDCCRRLARALTGLSTTQPQRQQTFLSRPLSGGEASWARAASQLGAFIIAEGVLLSDRPRADLLRTCFDAAARRHPLLRVHLPSRASLQLVEPGTEAIPVLFHEGARPESLGAFLQELVRDNAFPAPRPLLSVHVAQRAQHGCYLALRAHHTIWDGGNELLREILDSYGRLERGHDLDAVTHDSLPPLESALAPARLRPSLAALSRTARDTLAHDIPRSIQRGAPTETRVARLSISREQSLSLEQHCVTLGVSFGSYALAGAMAALRTIETTQRARQYAYVQMLDFRPLCSPPIPYGELGSYAGGMTGRARVMAADAVDALAQALHAETAMRFAKGEQLSLHDVGRRMFDLGVALGGGPRHGRTHAVGVSILPTFARLARRYGSLVVHDACGLSSIHSMGPCFHLLPYRFDERWHVAAAYPHPYFSPEQVHALTLELFSTLTRPRLRGAGVSSARGLSTAVMAGNAS